MTKELRYTIFELNTFDTFTAEEFSLYECNDKEALLEYVEQNNIRCIHASRIYKNGLPRQDKLIARFEDEVARLSEHFTYIDDKHIPFLPEIAVMRINPGPVHETIMRQIILNGITIAGEEYVCYSSSANQMKNSQIVLLQKDFYQKHKGRLLCGLDIEQINQDEREQGCNMGKFLAYTSLPFSKSVVPDKEICIDEVLVLPEFETILHEKVVEVSIEHLYMEEHERDVPVNHMDGCGIFLPGLLPQSCQIRGGFIKGLVVPFDFKRFIDEKIKAGVVSEDYMVTDTWGQQYTLSWIRDNIKMILNASQLKMWKHYDSWADYKQKFKDNGCQILINNIMHYSTKGYVPSTYQFLQTIPRANFTDENMEKLAQRTVEAIVAAKKSVEGAFELIDVDEDSVLNTMLTAVKMYPALLNTSYIKKRVIDDVIQKNRKMARGGKVFIEGYYSYIVPDVYATCEYWFCGEQNPVGLIPAGHVYNRRYADSGKTNVCCLRSPHLSDCEHGLRKIVDSEEIRRWYGDGQDTIISSHDLLLLTLQADVDGDECLITCDETFLDLVPQDKVPLYYVMQKAKPAPITSENMIQTLLNSFNNTNIGEISNALTKHYNLADEIDTMFIRFMTAYNNFVIDFPKSQYLPSLGEYEAEFTKWKSMKPPHFFMYAKDKKRENCAPESPASNIDRLSTYVAKKTTRIKSDYGSGEKFNAGMLMDQAISVDRKSEVYDTLCSKMMELTKKSNNLYMKKLNTAARKKYEETLEYDLFYFLAKGELGKILPDDERRLVNYLIDIEYCLLPDRSKDILWNCYGDIIVDNLMKNQGKSIPYRKLPYQSASKKETAAKEIAMKVADEIEQAQCVDVPSDLLDFMKQMPCRKGCERDRLMFYLLWVLSQRRENKSVYLTKDGLNLARLNQMLDSQIADKAIGRLENNGYITVNKKKAYTAITVNGDFSGDILFTAASSNPLVDYYEFTGEKSVKTCIVCGRKFIATGNTKTCSKQCHDLNAKLKKHKN